MPAQDKVCSQIYKTLLVYCTYVVLYTVLAQIKIEIVQVHTSDVGPLFQALKRIMHKIHKAPKWNLAEKQY